MKIMLVLVLFLGFFSGCVTKTGSGALLGGALGALAGQAIGKDTKGTLIGAGVGAAVGGVIGNQEDAKDKKK
jgi:outer membrane lipoprotein SlyB